MADQYIDYFEVTEYGTHFTAEVKKLATLSKLVDINALRAKVQTAIDDVNTELKNAGIQRSDLRDGRDAIAEALAPMRDLIERFYHHLLSLPLDAGVDVNAFFPGKTLGTLAKLKPADLTAKADQVLLGFATKSSASVAGLAKWQGAIEDARATLGHALRGKQGARGTAVTGTAELAAARERFLTAYNGVAKPLIRGLLAELGRADDFALFFLDLQVNERAPKKRAEAKPDPETPPPPTA
jgi:hypothetical protein